MAPRTAIEWVGIATRRRMKLRPAAVQRSSGDLWRGIRLEHRLDVPGEVCEGYLLRHVIALHLSSQISQELYWSGRGWKQQRVPTRSIRIFPARVPYAARWKGSAEVLLLEVAPEFVAAVANRGTPSDRLELRPFVVAEDRFLAQTVLALQDDLRAGSPAGRLYGESLGVALAAHLVRKYTDVTPNLHKGAELSSASTLGIILRSTCLSRILQISCKRTYIASSIHSRSTWDSRRINTSFASASSERSRSSLIPRYR